jgi:hypothetical protein
MSEINPEQSVELLKELHILTKDGKLNQDSRRKLKQIYHLFQFIEPLLLDAHDKNTSFTLVDHGAGKSYLGFILYDLFFKNQAMQANIIGIETRSELVAKSELLQKKFNFERMSFINATVKESENHSAIPNKCEIVTALHACDTATDDAIDFALQKQADHLVLIPCCQAEVAAQLRQNKKYNLSNPLVEIYRHPLHTRELGSHLTNALRCLRLEAHGYDVTVTEFTGFEHSMKNELILAKKTKETSDKSRQKITEILKEFKIQELSERFN